MASAAAQKQQEKNKQVVRQFYELLDRHDMERMGQLLVSNTNYSFQSSGMPHMDWNEYKQLLIAVTRAFPDINHNIKDIVAEGDKVAVRYNIIDTHKGELQGIPPTGKEVSFSAMDFITLIDGKVAEG